MVRLLFVAWIVLGSMACARLPPADNLRSGLPPDSLLEIDGRTVHAQIRGEGPPVLLLHGFGGSSYSWRRSVPALSARYRTIAVDLNGFGWSDRPERLQDYDRGGQIRLILAVMDHLEIDNAHVVGHSYGGGLAITLAALHPDRVRSMVLVDSTAPDYAWSRRKRFASVQPVAWLFVRGIALRPSFVRRVLERSIHDDALVTDEMVEAYLQRLRVKGSVRAFRGLTAPGASEPGQPEVRLEELEPPVLVVWGEHDELIPLAAAKPYIERMRSAELRVIEGAGHAPMEESPVEFNAEVLRFLDELEAARTLPRRKATNQPIGPLLDTRDQIRFSCPEPLAGEVSAGQPGASR